MPPPALGFWRKIGWAIYLHPPLYSTYNLLPLNALPEKCRDEHPERVVAQLNEEVSIKNTGEKKSSIDFDSSL